MLTYLGDTVFQLLESDSHKYIDSVSLFTKMELVIKKRLAMIATNTEQFLLTLWRDIKFTNPSANISFTPQSVRIWLDRFLTSVQAHVSRVWQHQTFGYCSSRPFGSMFCRCCYILNIVG
jgi:hypothetical protein